MMDDRVYVATPHDELIRQLMDSCVPKTEREHAACREIERLRALLAEVCPPGLQKVSADLDARIRSALAAKGE